jgi:heptosyltransferase-2
MALAYPKKAKLPEQILYPQLTSSADNIINLQEKFQINQHINPELPTVGLAIGAKFGEAKCWPKQYFIDLAHKLAKTNQFNVFILGTETDITIDTNVDNIINFSGRTSVTDAIDLLSLTNTVVCNDSGLMHIAASLHKKIIAIYGATSEKFTPPLTKDVITVNKHLECSPCFARSCPLQHHNCMKTTTVDEIFKLIVNN